MRLIVCGGRSFRDQDAVDRTLDAFLQKYGASLVIVHGAATGADMCAHQWALSRCVRVEPYPANWKAERRAAGPNRNRRMLETGVQGVLAFPGGTGTENMISQAHKAGVFVWRFFYA